MLLSLLNGEISQSDYMNCNDVTLLYRYLPKKVYGFIFKYDSRNIITINCNISDNKKKITLLHELAHLELSHLDKELLEFKIEGLEDEADKYIKFLIESMGK